MAIQHTFLITPPHPPLTLSPSLNPHPLTLTHSQPTLTPPPLTPSNPPLTLYQDDMVDIFGEGMKVPSQHTLSTTLTHSHTHFS